MAINNYTNYIFFIISSLSVSGSGPSLSELSLLAGRRSGGEGGGGGGGILGTPTPGVTGSAAELHAAAAAAYSRLTSPYMDPIYAGLHTSPTASLRLSPIDSRGKHDNDIFLWEFIRFQEILVKFDVVNNKFEWV
jgi:hypothetical protein